MRKAIIMTFKAKASGLIALLALLVALTGTVPPAHAAVNVFKNPTGDQADPAKVVNNDGNKTFQETMKQVISTMLVVLGMVSVIIIVIGGIRYATSNGDQGAITSAKNTILYAVIGLVVAIFAFAIVNFVISAFK